MATYHVGVDVIRGVDVTRSTYAYVEYVDVDADSEEEARELALIEAEERSSVGVGALVGSKVHFINEEK